MFSAPSLLPSSSTSTTINNRRRPRTRPPISKRPRRRRTPSPISPISSESSYDDPEEDDNTELDTESDRPVPDSADTPRHGGRHPQIPPSSTPTSTVRRSAHLQADTSSFNLTEPIVTSIPIFRRRDVRDRPVPAELSEQQQGELSFDQWLDYYLSHPSTAKKRAHLYTDDQYLLLLEFLVSNKKVVEFCDGRPNSEAEKYFLWAEMQENTYKFIEHQFIIDPMRKDCGPVLVCFKDLNPNAKGETYVRRPATSTKALVKGDMRRVIPYSQLSNALSLCHHGDLNVSHNGMDAAWGICNRRFHGIPRELIRMYITKCPVCQIKQPRQHKATLVPIVSRALWERVVVDLIDMRHRPSMGFKWIWHAADHFSKFRFLQLLVDKSSAHTGAALEAMLRVTGPIKILQHDRGTEFQGDHADICARWGMEPIQSSPYHPQTNGLVERYNGVFKRALFKWCEQQQTLEWAPVVSRLVYQLNISRPRTTKVTPYQLAFGRQPPDWVVLPGDSTGSLDDIDIQLAFDDVESIVDVPTDPVNASSSSPAPAAAPTAGPTISLNPAAPPSTASALLNANTAALDLLSALTQRRELPSAAATQRSAAASLRSAAASTAKAKVATSQRRESVHELSEDDDLPGPTWELPPLSNPRPPSPNFISKPLYKTQMQTQWDDPLERLQRPLPAPLPTDFDEGEDHLLDLEEGKLGCITPSMAVALCTTCQFYRVGGVGDGRCAFSSFFNAIGNGCNRFARVVQCEMYDRIRAQLERWADRLTGVALKRAKEEVFNCGNTAGLRDLVLEDVDDDDEKKSHPPLVETVQQRHLREHLQNLDLAWKSVLSDLSVCNRSLGWDALVLLTIHYQLNILLFVSMRETKTFHAGTEAAERRWAEERGESTGKPRKRQRTTRKWERTTLVVTPKLVGERLRQGAPFAVLYHRCDVEHVMNRGPDGKDFNLTYHSIGHYEALVATRGGDDTTTHGLITPTNPAYPDVLSIATRALSVNDVEKANVRSAADYDRTASGAVYKKGDAVGVRVRGSNPRKGSGSENLPCVVVALQQRIDEDVPQSKPRTMYQVVSKHGVLRRTYKVDQLVPLSINNYPDLLELRSAFADLSAEDIEAKDKVSINAAMTQHRAEFTPATLTTSARQQQQHQRAVQQRKAAVAAETAIAASQSSVPVRPSSPIPAAASSHRANSPSRIVKIISQTKTGYRCQWSQPVGNPEITTVAKKYIHSHRDAHIRELGRLWEQDSLRDDEADSEMVDVDLVRSPLSLPCEDDPPFDESDALPLLTRLPPLPLQRLLDRHRQIDQ